MRYLLLKRTPERGDFWQGVTGGREENENLSDTALREVFEETGFRLNAVTSAGYRYAFEMRPEWEASYAPGVKIITEDVFYALLPEMTVPALSEHSEAKWVDFETALSMLLWENNKKALRVVDGAIG